MSLACDAHKLVYTHTDARPAREHAVRSRAESSTHTSRRMAGALSCGQY